MSRRRRRLAWVLTVAVLALALPRTAAALAGSRSTDGVWVDLGSVPPSRLAARPSVPQHYRVASLDVGVLGRILATAPSEKDRRPRDGVALTLPLPDGTFAEYRVVASEILGPDLQKELPDFHTYLAQGVSDPSSVLRLDCSPAGLHAYGRTAQGVLEIDPWDQSDPSVALVAWASDLPAPGQPFVCRTVGAAHEAAASVVPPEIGPQLYTYELVVTCTGEYTQYWGGQAPAMAAAAVTINRLDAIFENDVAVRYLLTAVLAFPDAASDPFPSGAVVDAALLAQNQNAIDSILGDGAYDLGVVFTRGEDAGLADVGVVCVSGSKAHAGASTAFPSGDGFDVAYVAHVVGHEMGAEHTFNGTTGQCAAGRHPSSAYEPGSGSTVMSNAGRCGAENVISQADGYFHEASIVAIAAARNASGCAVVTSTGNIAPVCYGGPDATIPRSTNFILAGNGSDPDGDALSYCWEETDLGAPSPPTDPYGPLLRSRPPVTMPGRAFPDSFDVIGGFAHPYEDLPTVNRTLHMHLTVRDNAAGGGGIGGDDVVLTVSGAPLRVLTPNGGETFARGQTIPVTWEPGGFAASTVTLYLRGPGWSTPLGTTPNDGAQSVRIPCSLAGDTYRLWIEAAPAGDPYLRIYDVSDDFFTVVNGLPDFAPQTPAGWADSTIPHPAPDYNGGSAPLPASLVGDGTSYAAWAHGNLGDGLGCSPFAAALRIDERVARIDSTPPGPRLVIGASNDPFTVAGGRHTLWQVSDPDNTFQETNEANNGYARQWVWQPANLPLNSVVTRPSPPVRDAGQQWIPSDVPAEDNLDGLRITPILGGGQWRCVAVSNPDAAADDDVKLFSPSTGISNGFTAAELLAKSTYGAGATDAVVFNTSQVGTNGTYDVGALRYDGGGNYRIEYRTSPTQPLTLTTQSSVSGALAAQQMVALQAFQLAGGQAGRVAFILDHPSTGQPVHMALFDPGWTFGGMYDAQVFSTTDAAGREIIDTTVDQTSAAYGIVIYRQASEGVAAIPYTLTVQRTPADLTVTSVPGSGGNIVPRGDTSIPPGQPVPAPATLPGDQPATALYTFLANIGAQPAAGFHVGYVVDGVIAANPLEPFGSIPGSTGTIYSLLASGLTVRGGRHTASVALDSGNSVAELSEANNVWGHQWVWQPVQLAPATSVTRAAPPDFLGGGDTVPNGYPFFGNIDGVRSPAFAPQNGHGFWAAMAILPDGAMDADLSIYVPSTGAQDGFANPLHQSLVGGSAVDYVLADLAGPIPVPATFDVGVVRSAGSSPYVCQTASSLTIDDHIALPSTYGPFTLADGQILRVLEIGTFPVATPVTAHLHNLSGGANLALVVHQRDRTDGYYDPTTNLASADQGGDGADESITAANLPTGQYVAVVVAKRDGAQLHKSATFTLEFTSPATGVGDADGVPGRSGIAAAYPNPFNPQITLKLAIGQAGRATLKIYDMGGHLVRTLLDGDVIAGERDLVWTGTDDAGQMQASGVYLARLKTPDGHDQRRLVLVK